VLLSLFDSCSFSFVVGSRCLVLLDVPGDGNGVTWRLLCKVVPLTSR